jgi:hypothetical protein
MSTIIEAAYGVNDKVMTESYVNPDFKRAASDRILTARWGDWLKFTEFEHTAPLNPLYVRIKGMS